MGSKGCFFRWCPKLVMPTLCYILHLSCICSCSIGLHKSTEWSQCRVTIVYSFHCTIWWLALLYPHPLLSHFLSLLIFSSITVSLVVVLHSALRDELVTLQMWGWAECFSGKCLALLCQQYSSDCLSWTMKSKTKQVLLLNYVSLKLRTSKFRRNKNTSWGIKSCSTTDLCV